MDGENVRDMCEEREFLSPPFFLLSIGMGFDIRLSASSSSSLWPLFESCPEPPKLTFIPPQTWQHAAAEQAATPASSKEAASA